MNLRLGGKGQRWFHAFLVMLALLTFGQAVVAPVQHGTPAVMAQDEEPAAPAEESLLVWLFKALGIRYVISFLFLSFVFVATFVMNILAIRRQSIVPLTLIDNFENSLKERKWQEAYEMAKNDESYLGKVLAAGMSRLSAGPEQAQAAMQETADVETMRLDHRLSYLALVGSIAPLVGLLGTVDGMVGSFSTIARSTTTPKPAELAVGISMALVTTLAGLVLAIPALISFNLMKNRVQALVLEATIMSDQLLSKLQSAGSKKSSAAEKTA